MKRFSLFAVLLLGCALNVQAAGVIRYSGPLTTDASTGISSSNVYTHAVDGALTGAVGSGALVNGVQFSRLTPTVTPANFSWTVAGAGGVKNGIDTNLGTWSPAGGGVTGAGLINLLDDFTYESGISVAPATQTFTLSGLTPGQQYDTRLYIRSWSDLSTSDRFIGLTFTNGADVDTLLAQTGSILDEDRPQNEGLPSINSAYYISYSFVAQGTSLAITTPISASPAGNGGFHMYALTNQLVPEPASIVTWLVLCSSAIGLVIFQRRRQRASA